MSAIVKEVEPIEPLPLEEKIQLDELEARITHARHTFEDSFRDFGTALGEICERKLYRSHFQTFEAYAEKVWNISRRRIYQIIDAAKTAATVDQIMRLPNARVAGALAGLTDEEKRQAAEVLKSLGGEPTADDAEKAATKVSKKKRERNAASKARADAKAKKATEKARRDREAYEAKLEKKFKAEEAKRVAKEKAEAQAREKEEKKRTDKEAAAESKREAREAKANKSKPAKVARGGLAASQAEAQAQRATWNSGEIVAAWWKSNRKQLLGHPAIAHDELVKRIVALLEGEK